MLEKSKQKIKKKWKRPKYPIKIGFLGGHPKCEKIKKRGFLAKIA